MKTAANSTTAKTVSLAAILLLLLQVQVVFACAMPEHAATLSAATMADGHKSECDCCTGDLAVSLKTDCRDQQAILPQTKFGSELPQLAAPPRAEWPPILAPPASFSVNNPHTDPATPGSRTWLATLRLRI